MIRLTAALMVAGALGATPAAAKTLVFCSEGNPEALNPQIVTTTTGINAGRPMFNTLVEFEAGSTKLLPGLAESWTVSADGTEYVFRLRRGVKFHSNAVFKPSREMNADDVLFSLLRQWKSDHPFHAVSGSRYDYFQDLGMPDVTFGAATVLFVPAVPTEVIVTWSWFGPGSMSISAPTTRPPVPHPFQAPE